MKLTKSLLSVLSLFAVVVSAFGDVHQKTPVFFDTGSSLNIGTGVTVTGLVKPSGSATNGQVAVFLDSSTVRPATSSEVFHFTDDGTSFIPFWNTAITPHAWDKMPTGGLGGGGGGLSAVQDDLTPKLGGDLDLNGKLVGGVDLIATLDSKPTIVGQRFVQNKNAADSNFLSYTTGATDETVEVSMDMSVVTATAISTSMHVQYTNEHGTNRDVILPICRLDGNWISGGLITTTGTFQTPVLPFHVKTGTTLKCTVATGTFTSVGYDLGAVIKRVQ